MASGYVDCACRDCFDIAVGDDDKDSAFCGLCADAGCTTSGECQRPDAYGADQEHEDDDEVT
jgi:hypothetical protein